MSKNIGTIKYNNGGVYDDFFPRTVYGAITSSSDSATTLSDDLTSIKQKQETMKEKLDTVDKGANKYTHPTTSGNRHIPSGGSAGQVLKWSADGTAVWGSVVGNATYDVATPSTDGLMSKEDKNKLDTLSSDVSLQDKVKIQYNASTESIDFIFA